MSKRPEAQTTFQIRELELSPHQDECFRRAKDKMVMHALVVLFLDKCAFCEQRFVSTLPLDVEHDWLTWMVNGFGSFYEMSSESINVDFTSIEPFA